MIRIASIGLLCLVLSTTAFATDTWFGGWQGNDFFNAGNWTGGLPQTGNDAWINGAQNLSISYSPAVGYGMDNLNLGAYDGTMCTLTVTGGDVAVGTNLCVGGLWTAGKGTINMNGGVLGGNAIYVGHHDTGIVNVNGGTLNAWGLLKLGGDGGTGLVNINSGTVIASQVLMINSSQKIVIDGGMLDVTSAWGSTSYAINSYLDSGWISAAAGKTLIVATYAGPGGYTGYRISAVPEPITMVLLAAGGLFLRNRKK